MDNWKRIMSGRKKDGIIEFYYIQMQVLKINYLFLFASAITERFWSSQQEQLPLIFHKRHFKMKQHVPLNFLLYQMQILLCLTALRIWFVRRMKLTKLELSWVYPQKFELEGVHYDCDYSHNSPLGITAGTLIICVEKRLFLNYR